LRPSTRRRRECRRADRGEARQARQRVAASQAGASRAEWTLSDTQRASGSNRCGASTGLSAIVAISNAPIDP